MIVDSYIDSLLREPFVITRKGKLSVSSSIYKVVVDRMIPMKLNPIFPPVALLTIGLLGQSLLKWSIA